MCLTLYFKLSFYLYSGLNMLDNTCIESKTLKFHALHIQNTYKTPPNNFHLHRNNFLLIIGIYLKCVI